MWIKSFPIHHTNPPPSNKPSAPTTSRKTAKRSSALWIFASANTLASDFADQLGRPQRNTALAIQQIIMLAELAVNRALDRVDP